VGNIFLITQHVGICLIYHIVGFYHKDFNITFGSIHNIKSVLFLLNIIFCGVSYSNTSIILQAIVYRSTIDLLGFINLWIHYQLHIRKVTVCLRRYPYLSIHMVAMNTRRDNQFHPIVTE